jgi:PPOX class probable F420-dependent enzyme
LRHSDAVSTLSDFDSIIDCQRSCQRQDHTVIKIPESHLDLLERPLYCHLATVSPGGRPQSNPMWVAWDGTVLRFTHTNTRRKYRQLQTNPNIAISITDPDNPARYLEVRATVTTIEDDPTGSQYSALAERYGRGPVVPPDAAQRVTLIAEPNHVTTMG